jgi:hypothetical protein
MNKEKKDSTSILNSFRLRPSVALANSMARPLCGVSLVLATARRRDEGAKKQGHARLWHARASARASLSSLTGSTSCLIFSFISLPSVDLRDLLPSLIVVLVLLAQGSQSSFVRQVSRLSRSSRCLLPLPSYLLTSATHRVNNPLPFSTLHRQLSTSSLRTGSHRLLTTRVARLSAT